MSEEQRINACKVATRQIHDMLGSNPQDWRNFINVARTLVAHLDSTTLMQQTNRVAEQAIIISTLQRLAFIDVDNAPIVDVAAWCTRQWLVIHQRDPQNLAALRGIGQVWLSRAQPTLARIHRVDGSSSSSGGSSRSAPFMTPSEDDHQAAQALVDAERRAGSADYVEARGFLQPATDYLERAVAAASAQQSLSGDLLAITAEAYMSLGNVSSPRGNEHYFRRALQLLRAASAIPGYALSRYLQQYLDDYGRLVE